VLSLSATANARGQDSTCSAPSPPDSSRPFSNLTTPALSSPINSTKHQLNNSSQKQHVGANVMAQWIRNLPCNPMSTVELANRHHKAQLPTAIEQLRTYERIVGITGQQE